MADRVIGLLLVLMSIVSVVEGDRVMREYREFAMFDEVGPDHYLQIVGILLGVLGIAMIVQSFRRPAEAAAAEPPPAGGTAWTLPPYVVFTLLLVVYAVAMRAVGYPVATTLFFIAAFYLAGCRPALRSAAMGGVAGVVCYVLFVQFAEMPLPRTPWLNLL